MAIYRDEIIEGTGARTQGHTQQKQPFQRKCTAKSLTRST